MAQLKIPTYNTIRNFELVNQNQWYCAFVNHPQPILNEALPVKDLNLIGISPMLYETEIRKGVPLSIYQGYTPPTDLKMSLFENSKYTYLKLFESWIANGSNGVNVDSQTNSYNVLTGTIALSPKNLIKNCYQFLVKKYNSQGIVEFSYLFYVLSPTEPISQSLTASTGAIEYDISLRIVGLSNPN